MRCTSMLRPVINVLLLSALLTVGLTATIALAAPDIQGCSGANDAVEECETGTPNFPNGFGAVTSQRASTEGDIGDHSSGQVEPRKGVGNVARTDENLADALGVEDTGASPGDHACLIGELDDFIGQDPDGVTDCEEPAGLPGHPGPS